MTTTAVRRIVVGTDGSEPSKAALRWALEEAEIGGDDVTVVRVWALPEPVGGPLLGEVVLDPVPDADELREELDGEIVAIRRAIGSTRATVRPVVLGGRPAAILADESRTADLVVVGTRGLGAVRRLVLGSVSRLLIATSDCPVVVVEGRTARVTRPIGRAPAAQSSMDILVGVGDGHRSDAAVAWAADEARRTGRGLTLLHVYSVAPLVGPTGPIRTPEMRQEARDRAQDVLHRARRLVHQAAPGLQVATAAIEGHVVETVVDLAANARLLVLGTHDGLLRRRLGNRLGSVLRESSTPVVVVPGRAVVVPNQVAVHESVPAQQPAPQPVEQPIEAR